MPLVLVGLIEGACLYIILLAELEVGARMIYIKRFKRWHSPISMHDKFCICVHLLQVDMTLWHLNLSNRLEHAG